jgi:hypothetical protein
LAPVTRIVEQGEQRLKVWFRDGTLPPDPRSSLADVRVVERGAKSLHVAYRGSPDPLLKWIAQYPVDRVAMPQTSLEEAFMQYYQSSQDTDAAAGGRRP